MVRRLATFALLLRASPLAAGEREPTKLTIKGFEKPVLVCVPSGYTPKKAWGLVLCLHGTGMRGADVSNAFADAREEVGAAGYFMAFPTSTRD